MTSRVKICGLSTPGTVAAAVEAGAAYVGFVFFEKSPRNLDLDTARALALKVPAGVAKVALTVNADNGFLDRLTGWVPLDMLQGFTARRPRLRVADVRPIRAAGDEGRWRVEGPGDLGQEIFAVRGVADQF